MGQARGLVSYSSSSQRNLTMLGSMRVAVNRVASASLPRSQAFAPRVRSAVGIRILDEKEQAMEKLYFGQEDEKLLKKMLENHPELNPDFQGIAGIMNDETTVDGRIKHIFVKHGIPPINKALIADLAALVEKQ